MDFLRSHSDIHLTTIFTPPTESLFCAESVWNIIQGSKLGNSPTTANMDEEQSKHLEKE